MACALPCNGDSIRHASAVVVKAALLRVALYFHNRLRIHIAFTASRYRILSFPKAPAGGRIRTDRVHSLYGDVFPTTGITFIVVTIRYSAS